MLWLRGDVLFSETSRWGSTTLIIVGERVLIYRLCLVQHQGYRWEGIQQNSPFSFIAISHFKEYITLELLRVCYNFVHDDNLSKPGITGEVLNLKFWEGWGVLEHPEVYMVCTHYCSMHTHHAQPIKA